MPGALLCSPKTSKKLSLAAQLLACRSAARVAPALSPAQLVVSWSCWGSAGNHGTLCTSPPALLPGGGAGML